MKKHIIFAFMVMAVLVVSSLTAFAASSDYYADDYYDGAIEGADLLIRDYNQLIEDINVNYPQMIAEKEQELAEAQEYLDSIDSMDCEEYMKEYERNITNSKIRQLERDIKSLNKTLEHKKESKSDYEIGIKQKQDESLSKAIQDGTSENSNYSTIEEYDEELIETTTNFWINTSNNTVEAKYRYKAFGPYEGWNYIPFVNDFTTLTLCRKDGTEIASLLQRNSALDTEETMFWTVPTTITTTEGPGAPETTVQVETLKAGETYMLIINGVKYYALAY